MRITDRPQLPMVQGTQQQTATAKTTAAAPTPAQANPMDRMFATQFVQAPVARMATAAQEVLPPAQTVPTDERLNRAIDDTFREVYEKYGHTTPQFPTGQQRTEFMNMAKEMRAQGKSVRDVEFAIADKLHLIRQGLGDTSDTTVNKLIDQTFEHVSKMYGGVAPTPTSEQRTELLKLAKDMSAQGKNGQDIQYAIADKVHSWRRDLGNTSDTKINGLIDKTFEHVSKMYGGLASSPTPEQRNELMTLAKKLSGEGKDAQQIEYAIADKVHAMRRGLNDTSDTKINQLIDKTFEHVSKMYGGLASSPTAAQRDELMKLAKKMSGEGKDAQQIEYAIADKVHAMRRGLGDTSDAKINQLIDKTFEHISKMYGGIGSSPTAAQRDELMKLAKKLSGEGKDAQQIEYAIADKVHTIRQGLDKTDDSALNRFIDEAFKKVFENPNRVPSERERSVWLKFAQDAVKQGMNGQSVVYALQDALRTSLHNQ